MKLLLIVAYLIIAPIDWLLMHLSDLFMDARSYIAMELMKRLKKE